MSRSDGSGTHLSDFSDEVADLVERALPAVVTLRGMNSALEEWCGSGFLVDNQGHVVTNHHVVDGAGDFMTATMHSGRAIKAAVLGSDPVTDLAVLSLSPESEDHLTVRRESPRLGELCIAIGSPLGDFAESVSLGVVSGLNRSQSAFYGTWSMEHMIQTDAAVNHGNSGGPLLDVNGLVIGVNDRGTGDPGAQNISFAISGDTVVWITGELIAQGSVVRSGLGVVVSTAEAAVDGVTARHLVVSGVKADTALCAGDVLLSVAGRTLRDRGDLFRSLTRELIGKVTSVEVFRDGKRTTVEVIPFEAHQSTD